MGLSLASYNTFIILEYNNSFKLNKYTVMDLSEIKSKLAKLQAKPGSNKTDKKNSGWKPSIGKQNVRIIPNKYNKKNPFTELYFYYGIGKKVMISPLSWGDKDPIAEFAKQLRSTNDKENWRLAKKLDPKMRVFVPVIVRGEENLGVRLWEFGKEVYKSLLGFAADEDYGDFTDIQDGFDFKIDAVNSEVAGRKVVSCTLRPRPKSSPISDDANLVNKWLEEQPDIMTINRKREYDDIKELLAKWLNPEAEEEQTAPTAPTETTPTTQSDWVNDNQVTEQERAAFTLNTSSSDKFDELFQ